MSGFLDEEILKELDPHIKTVVTDAINSIKQESDAKLEAVKAELQKTMDLENAKAIARTFAQTAESVGVDFDSLEATYRSDEFREFAKKDKPNNYVADSFSQFEQAALNGDHKHMAAIVKKYNDFKNPVVKVEEKVPPAVETTAEPSGMMSGGGSTGGGTQKTGGLQALMQMIYKKK